MKTNKRTEFKDYIRPTGQTFRQRHNLNLGAAAIVIITLGLIWLMAWGALRSLEQ